jgi:hypothetical protein
MQQLLSVHAFVCYITQYYAAITFCKCACVLYHAILCKFIEVFCAGGKITIWLPFETCLGLQISIINNQLQVASSCGQDNDPSGFLKSGGFLDWLGNC